MLSVTIAIMPSVHVKYYKKKKKPSEITTKNARHWTNKVFTERVTDYNIRVTDENEDKRMENLVVHYTSVCVIQLGVTGA